MYEIENFDTISIKNIDVFSRTGVFESEKILGQTFVVNIDLYISPENILQQHSDEINNTIDYSVVNKKIRAFARENPTNLVEAMAHNLAGMILQEFELCRGLRVTVSKPHIPVEDFSGDVSVTVVRMKK